MESERLQSRIFNFTLFLFFSDLIPFGCLLYQSLSSLTRLALFLLYFTFSEIDFTLFFKVVKVLFYHPIFQRDLDVARC